MNYTLTINLEGADEAGKSLDDLLKKVGGISSAPKISFSDWLNLWNDAPEKEGEKIGDSITKGATKKLASFNILDAWGKAKLKGLKDFWNDAIKTGEGGNIIKGLREPGGKDLAKVQALPDINTFAQSSDFKRILLGIGTGFLNPWIGSRVLSDELAKSQKTSTNGVAAGIFGKGGAVGFTEFYLLFKAVNIAMRVFISALKIASEWIERAIKNAHEIYGKALSMGLSTRLVAQRTMTANVLGIPEEQVMRFKQSTYVMQRLGIAINDISKDAPALAQISAEWKILDYEILAVASNAAEKLAPTLIGVAKAMDYLVIVLENILSVSLVFQKLNALRYFIPGLDPLLNIFKMIGTDAMKHSNFNQPLAMMKQLPASNWEKLGLVVGGGSTNYQKQIAQNTKEIATGIKMMVRSNGGKKPNPNFGFSSTTAQP